MTRDRSKDSARQPKITQPDLDLEGVDWSWTAESQDEMGQHFAKEHDANNNKSTGTYS
jgi:hypothetical protein